MTRKLLIAAAALGAMLCTSCEQDSLDGSCRNPVQDCVFSLELNFCTGTETRSEEKYTVQQDYEAQVNSVQILIYGSSGKLENYYDAGTEISGIPVASTSGRKTICALVNGPDLSSESAVSDISGFYGYTIDLGDNGTDADKGFVMAGSTIYEVSRASTSTDIHVQRLVARIALQKITSNVPPIYGTVTIDNVFLANVAGDRNLSGSASPSIWYNMAGRTDNATESSMIINGTSCQASIPELTFKAVRQDLQCGESHVPEIPYLLYCYPNGTSSDSTGWSLPFTGRKTRLVITATIAGATYYYPVTIDLPEMNKAYTVGVTISGPGATDPDIPVIKEAMSISTEIKEWKDGAAYEETI